MSYPSPCDNCQEEHCPCSGCDAWKKRYHIRQRQINAYARRLGQGRKVERWRYVHPEEGRKEPGKSPCEACSADGACDMPCRAYLQWWDERMGWFRRMYENRTDRC